jgi:hypothetical protein
MRRLIWPKRQICSGIDLRLRKAPVPYSGRNAQPVRGGAGAITVPLGLVRGVEMACGGANAIPIPPTPKSPSSYSLLR